MDLRPRRRRLTLSVATLAGLLLTVAADVATRAQLREAVALVEHTSEVKLAIAEAAEHVGEAHAARPSASAVDGARAALGHVRVLTRDNPGQQALVDDALVWIDRAAGELAADGHPADDTLAVLHERLTEMRAAEDALMALRVAARESARARNTWTLALSGLFTLALGYFTWLGSRRERKTLRQLAQTDELTGLPNRRAFLAHAQASIRQAEPFAILYADVNELKRINDALGHKFGDRVIGAAADVLRSTLRHGDLLARLGGDEFAAVLPKVTPQATASVIRRVRAAIDEFNAQNPDLPFRLSISLGLGCFDRRAPRALADVLASADHNMYDAKRGRTGSLSVIRAARTGT